MTGVFLPDLHFPLGRLTAVALCCLAVPLIAAGTAAAENETSDGPSTVAAESRLKDVEQALKAERMRDVKLAEEAAAFARQNEVLRREIISAARRAQDIEAELNTLEQELEVLTAQETAEFTALANRHRQLAGLLGALERIARYPPEAIVARKTDPARMVRSAILLRSAVPKINARASALRDELAILTSLSDEIEGERSNLRRTAQDLKLERARLEELLTRKASREERTRSEQHRAELRAQALAREADDLRDLVRRLEADRREREEAERKAREQALAEAARRAKQAAEAEAELLARAAVAEAERQMQEVIAAAALEAERQREEAAAKAAEDRETRVSVARAKVTLELAPDAPPPAEPDIADAAGDPEDSPADEDADPAVVALATDTVETEPEPESESAEPAAVATTNEDEGAPDTEDAVVELADGSAPASTAEPAPDDDAAASMADEVPVDDPEVVEEAEAAPAEESEEPAVGGIELALATLPDAPGADDAVAALVEPPAPGTGSEAEAEAQLAFAVPEKPAEAPPKAEPITNARGRLAMPSQGQIVERYGQRTKAGQTSKGLRIETRPDALVVATYDGRVAFAGPFRGYGQILIIEHGEGYHTLLAGLSEIYGTVGQWLLAGEPIGKMDPAGSANPVLYVEFRRRGQPINPLPWLASRSNKVHG